MSVPRLIIVSNRLPVVVQLDRSKVTVTPSSGGLATGMRGPHERSGGLWLGWPGDVGSVDEKARAEIDAKLAELNTVPLYLSAEEVERYYEGFSNGTIWPLFHYLLDRVTLDEKSWDTYKRVNERFADLVAARYRAGDSIWIHDYQLVLLPALLRARLPDAAIGFFLHIPFPASDVFRTLPWREEILRGMLGADLIGFHAVSYLQHFSSSLLRLLGLDTRVNRVEIDSRDVRLGVFPMGIDSQSFDTLARSSDVIHEAEVIRREAAGQRVILAVDRLDYTKGIRFRLRAIERLLEREPALRERVRFIQLAVPSRTNIDAYASLRSTVEEAVGHINGRFGTTSWLPIHYLYRSVEPHDLVALYRAADVALVTPLRDGMNLVAKEFVASRPDGDGVLVLSEFAGAAEELDGAILVNPYDFEGMSTAIHAALTTSEGERRSRMSTLRERVMVHDVHRWSESFLEALGDEVRARGARWRQDSTSDTLAAASNLLRRAPSLRVLLDYDGTLTPFARTPDGAAPDATLRKLIRDLAARPRTRVCIVSGRTRESLERWFGECDIGLAAEHGYWTRKDPSAPWRAATQLSTEWKHSVRPTLDEFAERTPGAFVEEKGGSIAWHFRRADREFGSRQANELHLWLAAAASSLPVEVVRVDKVLEVRTLGLDKGRVAREWIRGVSGDTLTLAMGDDRTDEEMFAALGPSGISIHVGPGHSAARYRIPDSAMAQRFLRSLLVDAA